MSANVDTSGQSLSSFQVKIPSLSPPRLFILKLYSAQAVKARLWGFTEMPGIDRKQIREEMLRAADRPPGTIFAFVKSGKNVLEFDAVGPKQTGLKERRGLALELYDCRQVSNLPAGCGSLQLYSFLQLRSSTGNR